LSLYETPRLLADAARWWVRHWAWCRQMSCTKVAVDGPLVVDDVPLDPLREM